MQPWKQFLSGAITASSLSNDWVEDTITVLNVGSQWSDDKICDLNRQLDDKSSIGYSGVVATDPAGSEQILYNAEFLEAVVNPEVTFKSETEECRKETAVVEWTTLQSTYAPEICLTYKVCNSTH
ncbi:hypothetical protein L596_013671 [Steinernema carpocapsae]|uniref:Uncharacterized protein n=1 Tax=Steinernema carpocapsae TaxID=34508 RepID=A0A4U5P105_STECR|nr:hypothetical protein L596_013671 [Steinernema carpocapsae]